MKVLMLDNRDSFVFNLVDAFARRGAEVRVMRNDAPLEALVGLCDESGLVVLSPGPGRPEDAGQMMPLLHRLSGRVPVLGVCLGHQALLAAAGAAVVRAPEPVHGRACRLTHDGRGPLAGLPSPLMVARYHSLGVTAAPPGFFVHGTLDGMAMVVSNPRQMQVGLQFHPESVATPQGDAIVGAVLELARRRRP